MKLLDRRLATGLIEGIVTKLSFSGKYYPQIVPVAIFPGVHTCEIYGITSCRKYLRHSFAGALVVGT
jgi:hypothetical protein